jgi:hypothetical protein
VRFIYSRRARLLCPCWHNWRIHFESDLASFAEALDPVTGSADCHAAVANPLVSCVEQSGGYASNRGELTLRAGHAICKQLHFHMSLPVETRSGSLVA